MRRGLDLIVAPLLIVPVVRGLVSNMLRRRLVCAFAAFLDDAESRVGCLLHPDGAEGSDLRERTAFRLLRSFGCGSPDYLCLGARAFEAASASSKQRFQSETEGMDWHAYGLGASAFAIDQE